ncbi:MAG: DUF5312 family protein [Spirochaetes bacterium]|nr:DUF5312 family protein [Spirochaetota bacterium]
MNVSSDNKTPTQNNEVTLSFIDKIMELITGVGSDERIKQKKLKAIARQINQTKNKFYNFKKDLVLIPFAKYVYDIFRKSQNLANFFDIKNRSGSIKIYLFDSCINSQQRQLKTELEREKIEEFLIAANDSTKAVNTIKKNLNSYIKSFDAKMANKVNRTYNQIANLSNLISFDWYYVIHKFDSGVTEDNFNYKPSFESLSGKYLVEDLININDYLHSINLDDDYKETYEYVKSVSGDPGLGDLLKKLINYLRFLKEDEYLTKVIQLISKDPYFKPKNFSSHEKIVRDHVMKVQGEVKKTVDQVLAKIKKEKISKILIEIFNTEIVVRMKHYSEKMNDLLKNKGVMMNLKYIDPLNYLKAFLLDICKGEIKPRVDFLIIKGAWVSHEKSSEYSGLLDKINQIADSIVQFDEKCADESVYGREMKRLAGLTKHNANAKSLMLKLIDTMDKEAAKIIQASQSLILQLGKNVRELLEDNKQKNPQIIVNLHKLNWEFSASFEEDMVVIYKKMANMLTILKNYSVHVKASAKQISTTDKE